MFGIRGAMAKARGAQKRHLPLPMFLFFLGLAALAAAVLLEHPMITNHAKGGYSVVFNTKTVISFLKEIGFALLIAWGVAAGIERQARERDEEKAEKTREGIARDVVSAVYGLNHDAAYVKTVIEHTLHSRIIREMYDCEYLLEQFTPEEEAELGIETGRLIKFTQISKYTFRNVSNKPITDFAIIYKLPTRASPRLQALTGIQRAFIDGRWLSKDEITAVESLETNRKSYRWPHSMPANGKVEVIMQAVSVKELSDNEIWRSLHPTYGGMDLVIRVKVPDLDFGINSYTATDSVNTYTLEKSASKESQARWAIPGPILPNESVVVWWRRPEDDGLPSPESVAAEQHTEQP